jgi:hypothetical protein
MLDIKIVQEALNSSQSPYEAADNRDSLISKLIHDIFGGEILKTHIRKGWHYYNCIDGKRIDFTEPKKSKISYKNHFDDIPATPDETCENFEQVEYLNFFMRFIWAFEEAIGLEKYRTGYSS